MAAALEAAELFDEVCKFVDRERAVTVAIVPEVERGSLAGVGSQAKGCECRSQLGDVDTTRAISVEALKCGDDVRVMG